MMEICYVQKSLFQEFGVILGVDLKKKCINILIEILMIFRFLPARPTGMVLGLPRELFYYLAKAR